MVYHMAIFLFVWLSHYSNIHDVTALGPSNSELTAWCTWGSMTAARASKLAGVARQANATYLAHRTHTWPWTHCWLPLTWACESRGILGQSASGALLGLVRILCLAGCSLGFSHLASAWFPVIPATSGSSCGWAVQSLRGLAPCACGSRLDKWRSPSDALSARAKLECLDRLSQNGYGAVIWYTIWLYGTPYSFIVYHIAKWYTISLYGIPYSYMVYHIAIRYTI